jgi:putative membrane protein
VFIDWVALLLLNMLIGYFLLAWYVAVGLGEADQKRWAPAFGMVGLIALVFGGTMVVTWPLPGPYGSIYGEMSVLFGITFLGASVSLAKGWDLRPVALYGFFAGLAAMVLAVRIVDLKLTTHPVMTGIGFLLSGLGGVAALPTLAWFRDNKIVRYAGALVLILAGLIWVATAYPALWMHAAAFKDWQPMTMRGVVPPPAH